MFPTLINPSYINSYHIKQISVYPVKSCAPIHLSQSLVTPSGLAWDREWVIINTMLPLESSSFPFVTQRTSSRLCLITPSFIVNKNLGKHPIIQATKVEKSFSILNPPNRQEPFIHTTQISSKSTHLKLSAPNMPNLFIPLNNPFNTEHRMKVNIWNVTCFGYDEGNIVSQWLNNFLTKDVNPSLSHTPTLDPSKYCLRLLRCPPMKDRRLSKVKPYLSTLMNVDPSLSKSSSDPPTTQTLPIPVRFPDSLPILIVNTRSIEFINSEIKSSTNNPTSMVSSLNFRPNIVVDGSLPFEEDSWNELRILTKIISNNPRDFETLDLSFGEYCTRCQMTTIDQLSGEILTGKQPLSILFKHRVAPKISARPIFGVKYYPKPSTMNTNHFISLESKIYPIATSSPPKLGKESSIFPISKTTAALAASSLVVVATGALYFFSSKVKKIKE